MIYPCLRSLGDKLFFSVEDVADLLGITLSSAAVLCARYVQKGLLIRVKRNVYLLAERWDHLGRGDFFAVANFLQIPSYISFLSALVYYEITTQVPRMVWESASLKRSKRVAGHGVEFRYYKIAKHLYLGFRKADGFFIAEREKAFLDSIYLASFGRYPLDIAALDLRKLDKRGLERWIGYYPERTQRLALELCKI